MEHMGKVFPNHPEDPWLKFPHVDEHGQTHTYYINTRTEVSTWDRPPMPTYLSPAVIFDRFSVPLIDKFVFVSNAMCINASHLIFEHVNMQSHHYFLFNQFHL